MNQLDQLTDILASPDKFKKKLADMKKQADRAEKSLSLIQKNKEIEPLHAKAKREFDEAHSLLEKTKAEMRDFENETRGQLEVEINGIDRRQAMLDRDQSAFTAHRNIVEEDLKAREIACKKLETSLKRKEKEVVKREAEAKELIKQWEAKSAILASALGKTLNDVA